MYQSFPSSVQVAGSSPLYFQSCTWAVVVSAGFVVVVSDGLVVVAVSFAVVVSLAAAVVVAAAAVGSVEVSEAAVVVVSPPPLMSLKSEPIPLQPLQEQPVMETAVIRAVTAQSIFNNFGFFFNMVLPHRSRISSHRSGITAVNADTFRCHVVYILEAHISAEFTIIYVVNRLLAGLRFAGAFIVMRFKSFGIF